MNDKMYDFPDKHTSKTTLSRCRLLLEGKVCVGMQKTKNVCVRLRRRDPTSAPEL